MATTPRDRLNREKNKVESLAEDGTISEECKDALLEYADALDSDKVRHKYRDAEGETKEYAARSVERYLQCLRICGESGFDLLDTTAEEFNDLIDRMHDDKGKSKVTLSGYQVAAEKFYRYHNLGVDPAEINIYKERSEPRYDETDMFTEEEVEALRNACGETKNTMRNRALLELLIFTGQRIRALVTLRIGDVELNPPGADNHGYIYLNDDYDREQGGGLKGATVRGRKRPMFGATKYVRDWIEYHPHGDDPDAWLFIGDPSHWKTDPNDHWAKVSADQVLRRIGEYADVDKPVNAHNFRHYCATVLYRDYDLDRDTIRMLFGHVEGSNALEETYSHLFDEDYIRKAEEALGYREQEERSPFTPETCPTCGELLEEHWRQCPNCQEVFGPSDDFEESVADARERATEAAIESTDPEEIEAIKAIIDAVDDPAALAERLATLED